MESQQPPASPLTTTQWLIVSLASLGFAFDIYELVMMPVIAGPAFAELLGVPVSDPQVLQWITFTLTWSTVLGGAFGLIGGYLTDRLGRRRVLTWSILLYAFSACGAGFATSAWMLFFLRCTTLMGVCIEFVAAVAWLAELFPNPKQREQVLGYTQAFSSFGGFLVTGANTLAVHYAASLPAIYGDHASWRYTLISGVFPALPLILIRPLLPESPVWQQKRLAGTLKRPSFAELFTPRLRRTTIVSTILVACGYATAFGALQLTPAQIVPGLPGPNKFQVEANGLKAQIGKLTKESQALAEGSSERVAKENEIKRLRPELKKRTDGVRQYGNQIQFYQEAGGLAGRFLLAFLAVRLVSRQRLLRTFQIPGLILFPIVYVILATTSLTALGVGIFLAGVATIGQFSFWGNYLPRVYPLHLRGTGESFAINVGGRILGAAASSVTGFLALRMPGETTFTKVAYAAATVSVVAYAVGLVTSFFLPEPHGEELPD